MIAVDTPRGSVKPRLIGRKLNEGMFLGMGEDQGRTIGESAEEHWTHDGYGRKFSKGFVEGSSICPVR